MILPLVFNITALNLFFLFIWTFISSFGVPSGLLALISFGAIAKTFNEISSLIIISFIAAVLGDLVAYELARKFSFFGKKEINAIALLKKYGFFVIFFTRFFLTGICAVVSYISGFEKFSRRKFILAVFLGEFLYAVIYILIGFSFGVIINDLLNAINYAVIAIILLFFLIYLFIKLIIPKIKKNWSFPRIKIKRPD